MSKQESAGAAWLRTVKTKNGDVKVLDLTMNDGKRFTLWPNSFKQPGEKSPDYRLQVNDYKPQNKANEQANKVQQSSNHPGTEDDLPF